MAKYNFRNKIECVKYFGATSDIDLRNKIVNEYDKLKDMNEIRELIDTVRNAGIDPVNGLNNDRPYNYHEDSKRELSYEESQRRLAEFRNAIEEDEDITKNMTVYERELYNNNKEEYNLYKLVNEGMDMYESEKARPSHTWQYEQKAKEYQERMARYNETQKQKLQENRQAYERSKEENGTVSLDDVINSIDVD